MKSQGAKWLDKILLHSQYIGLCTNEKQFKHELKRLGIEERLWPEWVSSGCGASTHFFRGGNKFGNIAIVCVKSEKCSPELTYALLVHEAVHIWQSELEDMGEENPGKEIEAYAIQNISQILILAYKKHGQS